MNIARADDGMWHIAEQKSGVYIRLGTNEGLVLTREQTWEFLSGLTGVMGNARPD